MSKKQTKVAVAEKTPATKTTVVTHNKNFPIVKSTRTEMTRVINGTKGRFFTSTHIDKDGNPRTMNAIKSNKPAGELGYLNVYSLVDKDYRMINPQTLTDLSFGGLHMVASKPRKARATA
jgi:hypothetical protein